MEKEQRIRVEILPRLHSLADSLWDIGSSAQGRNLDRIVNDLISILDSRQDENDHDNF